MHHSGPMVKWPKTPASHAGNEVSNPSLVTNICGFYYSEDPPVPIPNTVVKLVCAEDTWRAASRKNRSMPTQHSITLCCFSYSSLAQLAEHAAVNRRVVGSSPTGGANIRVFNYLSTRILLRNGPLAQLGRATGS